MHSLTNCITFFGVTIAMDRSSLRRSLRLKRKTLTPAQQADAALSATQQLTALPEYRAAKHIAVYWAADGELDPALLAAHARAQGSHIYLPVISINHAGLRHMEFREYLPTATVAANHFGIPEPLADAATLAPTELDMVIVPLVGFDPNGNRLGMGGGFYDTSFAFKKEGDATPLLVGFAHSCQACSALPAEEWDVPLDLIVTEQSVIRVND